MKRRSMLISAAGALCCTLLIFLFLSRITYFRWENSDDSLISRTLMGFEGGTPAVFNLYLHTFLMNGLALLSRLMPGKSWFALFQAGCLAVSCTVILYDLFLCRRRISFAGILAGGFFAGTMLLFPMSRLNFTTTAALLAAAGLLRINCCLKREAFSTAGAVIGILLLLAGWMLRPQSVLPSLPFLAAVLFFHRKAILCREIRKKVMIVIVIAAVCFGILTGVRMLETSKPEIRETIRFSDASTEAMDYAEEKLLALDDNTLAEIGWNRSELQMIREWYFMDSNITPEAMEKLGEALREDSSFIERLRETAARLGDFLKKQPRYLLILIMMTLLVLMAVLNGHALEAAAYWLMTAGMMIYLAWGRRLLGRAADCAILPGVLLLLLICAESTDRKAIRRLTVLVTAVLLLITGILCTRNTCHVLNDTPDSLSAVREKQLEEFALAHSENLIIRSPNLLRDTRLIADVSAGIPGNTMIWGDWTCRTPGWYHQIEQFGFDAHAFTGADLAGGTILLAWNTPELPDYIPSYISEDLGHEAVVTAVGTTGDITFFRFD